MDQMTVMIIGLCSVGFVAWALLCWSAERFFRVFLAISVVLHAGLFFIPFATGKSAPPEVTGQRLLPLTFIQGADAPAVEVPSAGPTDIDRPEDALGADDESAVNVIVGEGVVPEPEQARAEPTGATDPGLPRIEAVELFDFDKHPGRESYRRELQRTIQRRFEVPPELEAEGYEGRVRVWITLGRDGTVHAVELDPTMRSEDPRINQLTLDNLRAIAPEIPPLPDNVKDDVVPFNVIINYRIFRNR